MIRFCSGRSSPGINSLPTCGVAPSIPNSTGDMRVPRSAAVPNEPVVFIVKRRRVMLENESVHAERGERAASLAESQNEGTSHARRADGRAALHAVADDLDDALGIGIRQRSQQHGVDDRGDRTGRADADGERQDRSDGEGALPEEGANRDAEVGSSVAPGADREARAVRRVPGAVAALPSPVPARRGARLPPSGRPRRQSHPRPGVRHSAGRDAPRARR